MAARASRIVDRASAIIDSENENANVRAEKFGLRDGATCKPREFNDYPVFIRAFIRRALSCIAS